MNKHFEVNGYEYWTDLDVEPDGDNQKLWHYCFKKETEIQMGNGFYSHSPYKYMSKEEFAKHIQTVEVFNQG